MIKAIIFDCFGVVKTDSLEAAYRAFGGDFDKDREFINETIYKSSSGKIESSMPVFAEHLGISVEEWHDAVTSGTINHDVLDFSQELRKKYKVGMLTNIGKGGIERNFEPGFLDKYFDAVVASADIGFAKPEAAAYEIAADALGARYDECVMIDDRPEYCDGARSVGMQAVEYKSLEQLKRELGEILRD